MELRFDVSVKRPEIEFALENVRVVNTGGTGDHRQLTNRDAEDQHPIKAITGLQAQLNTIPPATERITNMEIEEMLT